MARQERQEASVVNVFAPFVSFRGYQNRGIWGERLLCRPFRAWAASERFPQGVARGLALPWAIVFRAFSPPKSVA